MLAKKAIATIGDSLPPWGEWELVRPGQILKTRRWQPSARPSDLPTNTETEEYRNPFWEKVSGTTSQSYSSWSTDFNPWHILTGTSGSTSNMDDMSSWIVGGERLGRFEWLYATNHRYYVNSALRDWPTIPKSTSTEKYTKRNIKITPGPWVNKTNQPYARVWNETVGKFGSDVGWGGEGKPNRNSGDLVYKNYGSISDTTIRWMTSQTNIIRDYNDGTPGSTWRTTLHFKVRQLSYEVKFYKETRTLYTYNDYELYYYRRVRQ